MTVQNIGVDDAGDPIFPTEPFKSDIDGELIVATLRNDLNNRSRQITYQDIANATGLTVRWLESFARGKLQKPPFAPICCLYSYIYKTREIKL